MKRRRRSIAAAVALTTGTIAASILVRRRSDRNRTRLDLYFEDGSMISLPDSASEAMPLLALGQQAIEMVRGGARG